MDDPSLWVLLFRITIGAVVVVGVYFAFFGRRADFVIDVRRGQVRCKGKLPLAVLQRLTPFLLEDMVIQDAVRIYGARSGGRIRVWFRGRLNPSQQQRIRNFLFS